MDNKTKAVVVTNSLIRYYLIRYVRLIIFPQLFLPQFCPSLLQPLIWHIYSTAQVRELMRCCWVRSNFIVCGVKIGQNCLLACYYYYCLLITLFYNISHSTSIHVIFFLFLSKCIDNNNNNNQSSQNEKKYINQALFCITHKICKQQYCRWKNATKLINWSSHYNFFEKKG